MPAAGSVREVPLVLLETVCIKEIVHKKYKAVSFTVGETYIFSVIDGFNKKGEPIRTYSGENNRDETRRFDEAEFKEHFQEVKQ